MELPTEYMGFSDFNKWIDDTRCEWVDLFEETEAVYVTAIQLEPEGVEC